MSDMKLATQAILIVLLLGCQAPAEPPLLEQPPAAPPQRAAELSESRRADHLKSFDFVWQKINDVHYDPKFGGLDWAAVKTELRPKMEKAVTEGEADAILQDLIGRLKLSHFGITSQTGEPSDRAKVFFEFTPPLARETRERVVQFGNLPPVPLRYVYKKLPENVGYFYLSVFFDPPKVMPAFREAIESSRACDGMILDLRHNPGGIGIMAVGIGNAFVEKPDQKLGTMIQRTGELNFVLNPQADPYTKALAILVDEHSASTTEILAAGLKDIGRARLFGAKTAGEALPSYFEILPNGDRFQYAVANYISTGGKPLEGLGVAPDQAVAFEPTKEVPDPVVKAAVDWIQSQAKGKK
jgi:hypothetical protein